MGEGRSFGLELMVQKTLGKTTGWLAYTLSKTDHRFKNGTINQGRWFPYKYDRRHSISLNLSHKFSDRIDAGASWIFNTGGCITIPEKATIIIRPDGSIEETGYISRRNNYRLPASHRLNLASTSTRRPNMVCYLEYQYLQCIQCHESEHRYSKYKMDTTYTTMISTKVFIMEIPGRRKLKLSSRK